MYVCVTAFSPTSLFLDRFWREFPKYVYFKSHTHWEAKPRDLKMIFVVKFIF